MKWSIENVNDSKYSLKEINILEQKNIYFVIYKKDNKSQKTTIVDECKMQLKIWQFAL